jgi:hypothetical protein
MHTHTHTTPRLTRLPSPLVSEGFTLEETCLEATNTIGEAADMHANLLFQKQVLPGPLYGTVLIRCGALKTMVDRMTELKATELKAKAERRYSEAKAAVEEMEDLQIELDKLTHDLSPAAVARAYAIEARPAKAPFPRPIPPSFPVPLWPSCRRPRSLPPASLRHSRLSTTATAAWCGLVVHGVLVCLAAGRHHCQPPAARSPHASGGCGYVAIRD